MKKIFTIAAAAAMIFGAASCQREELLNGKEGDSKVVFNVEIPEEVVTKAISDGTTVDELVYEIYVGDDKMYWGVEKIASAGAKQFVLELNLVTGMTYDLLFWAQKSGTEYYNTNDLRDVEVRYDANKKNANDEARDAFFGARTGFKATGIATQETIKLYRPFAQINFGSASADWDKAKTFIDQYGLKSQVVMTVPTHFSVAKGDILKDRGEATVTFDYSLCPASQDGDSYNEDPDNYINYNNSRYGWIAMNYVLAPKSESSMSEVTASFIHEKNDANTALNKVVYNVPFKQNYRTNILGEIFTGGNKFTVVIEPGFANDPIENFPDYTIAEPVMFAFQNGGSVTLTEDTPIPSNIRTDKDVIINLNGKTLKYNAYNGESESLIMARINEGGTLTINGPGKIVSNGYIASANEGSKVVVNGDVEIEAYTTAFQSNGGEIYLLGGTYSEINNEPTYLVNFIDAMRSVGTISIAGGTYHGFNPGDNLADGQRTNYLALGYDSVYNADGTYTVKAESITDYTIPAGKTIRTASTIKTTTIKGEGAGATINADFSSTSSQYIIDLQSENQATVDKLTITGSNKRNADSNVQRGIYLSNIKDNVSISEVVVTDVAYPINTAGGISADKITVYKSLLEGWTSIASFKTVIFDQVNFTIGDYFSKDVNDPSWNGCLRVGATTLVEDCYFDEGFYISLETLPEGSTITFKNCKTRFTEVLLTAENVAQYLKEAENGTLSRIIFENN